MKIAVHGKAHQAKKSTADTLHTLFVAVHFESKIDIELQTHKRTRIQTDAIEQLT